MKMKSKFGFSNAFWVLIHHETLIQKFNGQYCLKDLVLPPRTRGLKSCFKKHYNPKNKHHHTGVFECSNEASGCTYYNAKKLNYLQCTVTNKNLDNPKIFIFQNSPLLVVLPNFLSSVRVQSFGFFALWPVHPDASFQLSTTRIQKNHAKRGYTESLKIKTKKNY